MTWTFTGDPAANRFCDSRLEGLAQSDAAQGTTLLAIDAVTGCLSRPAAPKGIWQHDPDGCLPDFVGPLKNPEFVKPAVADPLKSHSPMSWEYDCGSQVWNLVRVTPAPGPTGDLAVWRKESCTDSWSSGLLVLEPLAGGKEDAAGVCRSPRALGVLPIQTQISPGVYVTQNQYYTFDQWQQAVVDPVLDTDILNPKDGETANLQVTAWRKETCTGGGSVQKLVGLDSAQVRRLLNPISWTPLETLTPIYALNKSNYPVPEVGFFGVTRVNPTALPIPNHDSVRVDLKLLPGWYPGARMVRLMTYLTAFTDGADFSVVLVFNGVERNRVGVAGVQDGATCMNEITVLIPPDGFLPIDFYHQETFPGPPGRSASAHVYVLSFEG